MDEVPPSTHLLMTPGLMTPELITESNNPDFLIS
jgi:hypothetical protein